MPSVKCHHTELVIFFTHAKKTVNDFFWLKRMILWTNEVPLGTELVQRIMSFSLRNHELVLTWRK